MTRAEHYGVSVQEYTSEVVTTWLCRAKENERVVPESEYKQLEGELTPIMRSIASYWVLKLPGFDEEDLIGFMQLKLYRTLAQNKYNSEKRAKSFFGVVFRNLMRTVQVRILQAESRGQTHQMYRYEAINEQNFEQIAEELAESAESVLLGDKKILLYASKRQSTRTIREV